MIRVLIIIITLYHASNVMFPYNVFQTLQKPLQAIVIAVTIVGYSNVGHVILQTK